MEEMKKKRSLRQEFEHNVFLTLEEVRYKIENKHSDPGPYHAIVPSLQKVRFLANNRINLNTIKEKLRLHSNSRKWMESIYIPTR